MALKPTIYKVNLSLSDMDRSVYGDFQFTLAQHPSENNERMMARVLAFCLNAHEDLAFTRGLSSVDEPELWLKTLDDQVLDWIEVGQPDPDRLKKASTLSRVVTVYSFGKSASTWWTLNAEAIAKFPSVRVYQFPWESMLSLCSLIKRNMNLTVTLTENTMYIADEDTSVELVVNPWQVPE